MASIDKRPDGRYRARWREYPTGPQKVRHFARKRDAERFLDAIRGDLAHGVYVDPAGGPHPVPGVRRLRTPPGIAGAYAALKRELATAHGGDPNRRSSYRGGKAQFISEVTQIALGGQPDRGLRP